MTADTTSTAHIAGATEGDDAPAVIVEYERRRDAAGAEGEPLLEVRNLVKDFPIRAGLLRRQVAAVHAVADVSFSIRRGTTLGLVGVEEVAGDPWCVAAVVAGLVLDAVGLWWTAAIARDAERTA